MQIEKRCRNSVNPAGESRSTKGESKWRDRIMYIPQGESNAT
ncbi:MULTISPECIES: hypothetical protein [Leptolyngbya]|nr:hypothetical protein [Leptolyngbya sp. FACHB-1624]